MGTVSRAYDDLGREATTVYGNGLSESFSYNIQGWEISSVTSLSGNTLFSETLHYFSGVTSGSPLYSGRVAGRSGFQNGASFSDFYTYDGAGRMTGSAVSSPVNTEKAISYDRSGNILSFKRYNGGTLADNFSWSYTGFRRSGFTYDTGGNITSNGTGGFTATYNRLGLPKTITASGSSTTYSFLADGTKESAIQSSGGGYVYLGSMRFFKDASGAISFDSAPWEGGRIIAGSATGAYDLQYFTRDYLGSVRLSTNGSGTVVFSSGYMPYGTGTNSTGSPMNDYRFSGKEEQSDCGLLDFGARFYDSRTATWLSLDPLAENDYSVSPYAYCADDPVNLVDPEGNNPIYSVEGKFLGTDDRGLQGGYIIMDESHYSPNMRHADALSKSYLDPLKKDVQESINSHFATLSSRPDWDGYLTLEEANDWYRNGNGQPLYVSLDRINLAGVFSLGEHYVGTTEMCNLLLLGSFSPNDALVYGTITLKRYPYHTVKAFSDRYDFDMKTWWNPMNWGRNIETLIGKKIAGNGKGYEIIIYGSKELKPILPWLK